MESEIGKLLDVVGKILSILISICSVVVLFSRLGDIYVFNTEYRITLLSLILAVITFIIGILVYLLMTGFGRLIDNSYKQVELSRKINAKLEAIIFNNYREDNNDDEE
ncbi:hypothetical protein KQI30_15230 [Clostridium bornimense]|uniref:hypothetical protein n=1 Tax=Clostridium bornimense TaxID=1216932 RepID=UPI001C11B8A3|nr:hypothetical protein [Clostridium bornimense]MBU5317603.1 hypothetical protein [Clostridium bornimense]